jgi:hypothetical protein
MPDNQGIVSLLGIAFLGVPEHASQVYLPRPDIISRSAFTKPSVACRLPRIACLPTKCCLLPHDSIWVGSSAGIHSSEHHHPHHTTDSIQSLAVVPGYGG